MPDQRSSTLLSGLSRAGLGFFKMVKEVIEPPMYLDPSLQVDPSLLQNCKPHHRRAVELAITDMYGTRYEALIRLPASWEKYMCERVLTDKRDLRLFLTFLQVTLWLSLSCAVQLLLLPPHDARSLWWMIPHLVITWVVMGQRFILAMHYAAHRPLFNPRGVLGRNVASALNQFPQVVLSNFFGMPAGCYYVHHIIMHHQANNVFPYDISSTMPYRRDSPLHFIAYVINFMLHTMLYLPFYAIRGRRFDLAFGVTLCCGVYLSLFPILYSVRPYFFITTFAISWVLGPFALMLGNYSQHIFVNPDDPKSNYGLACNHLNARFNMLTFNDGYHITHHVNEHTHWSEMPRHFIRNLESYEQGGAILFHGITFDDITFNVFAGEPGLRRLAKKVIQITPEHLSEEELMALFKKRLQPITSESEKLGFPQMSVFLANEFMWLGLYVFGFPFAIIPATMIPLFHGLYFLA